MRRIVGLAGGLLLIALVVAGPVGAQEQPADTTTTTTVELSAPTATSLAPPDTTVPQSAPTVPTPSDPVTTVPAQVLSAQETNGGGELALTGPDVGSLVGLGAALVAAGSVAVARSRRL